MALAITTVALPEAQNGVPYNVQMQASGGTPPYSEWSIDGISPNGYWLSITPEGQLVGTPGLIGPEEITIDLYDSATPPNYAQTTLYLTVLPAPAPATPFGIIPAYLYQQYAGDENLQALFAAYNAIAQYYIEWFISTPLGYYPGLSGDLLDWIAEGVYGTERTALASPASYALGPIASLTLAQEPFAYFSPPTSTLYSLTDDAFQRILTWNLYKGDGNRFSMRWLKRRIMRFLLGVNGTDPQGGITVPLGTENTQAISVTVADNVLTAEINQSLLSSQAQLTPGILQIFQLAFQAGQAGPLELPLQYESYVCNIVVSLAATVSPSTFSIGGSATTQTTGESSVLVLGGSGSYTYTWSWLTGGTGISINPSGSPSGSVADFSAAGMTPGDTYSGTAQCLVTDTITSDTTTCQVTVSITCYAALSASISPSSISATGATYPFIATGNVTASISGGSGSYSVSWGFSSGGANIDINEPHAVTTNFTGQYLAPGGSDSGTAQCTVTDAVTGDQVSPTCAVSISRVTEVTVSVSPSTATSSGTPTAQTTNTVTATGSGGSGSYSYAWTIVSGPFSIGTPSSATTNFTCSGMTPGNTYTGSAQCIATDGYGQTSAPVDVPISITCLSPQYTGTLVAGEYTEGSGEDETQFYGYNGGSPAFGSLSPTTDYYGATIEDLYFVNSATLGEYLTLGIGADVDATYFTTLYIGGTAYSASSAAFAGGAGSTWTWTSVSNPFTEGDSYPITIDYP